VRSFKVKNTSSETAPPGCVLEFTGTVDADGTISVQKPTLNNSMRFLVNGFAAIPGVSGGVYSVGEAFPPTPQFVAGTVDADALTPLTAIGTKSGDWFLRSGQTGFFCVGPVSHGYINVLPEPGTTGTSPPPPPPPPTVPTGIYIKIGAQPSTGSTNYAFTQYAPPTGGGTAAVSGGVVGDGTTVFVRDISGTFNDPGIVDGYAWAYPNPQPGMEDTYIMGPWVKKTSYPIDHLDTVCDDDGTLSVTVVYSTTPVIEFRIGK